MKDTEYFAIVAQVKALPLDDYACPLCGLPPERTTGEAVMIDCHTHEVVPAWSHQPFIFSHGTRNTGGFHMWPIGTIDFATGEFIIQAKRRDQLP